MKNVETAMFPLIFVLCICGLCVIEYPQGRPRLYLTILYILTSWLLYIYFIMRAKTLIGTYAVDMPPIYAVFAPIIYFSIVVAFVSIVLNIYYNKRFKGFLKKLDMVNDTLEELGMLKNHAQLRARMIWLIIGWITSICVMNFIDTIWFTVHIPKHDTTVCIYLSYVTNHMIHIGTLCEITFLTLLRYIGTLFEHVNQCIQTLIEQKKRQVRLGWATSTSSSFMHRHLTDTLQSNQLICLLMHIHLELSSMSRELSIIFGLQMVMQIAVFHFSAMQFILELYYIIVSIKNFFTYEAVVTFFCVFSWAVRCILHIIVFGYICDGVCTKANRAEMFLNRLANITFDVETQENIMQFLLEIVRRPLRISGLGLYDYGYKLIHQFVERSVKMIIIVIQAR